MASLSQEENGNFTIQVVCSDGKRRSIRLGSVTKKTASEVKLKVEQLNSLAITGLPMDGETAGWVSRIGDDLAAKLAAVGLIPERQKAIDLDGLLNVYASAKEKRNKAGTRTNHRTISNDLRGYFRGNTPVKSITPEMAEKFLEHLRTRTRTRTCGKLSLAVCTISRRLRRVKSIFAFAVKENYIGMNPFTELQSKATLPENRKAYVTASDALTMMEAANPTWRIIIALSRFAGLRNPSEVFRLKWSDVNFVSNRMTIPNVKTGGQTGKDYRVCPIFGDLRPALEDAFELAPAGTVYVVSGEMPDNIRAKMDGPNGSNDANTRTVFMKLIKRCGLTPWPRLFHTLRASCETDLLAKFPISAVTEWLGHSATIALKHYSRVPEHLYELASKNSGAESGAVAVRNTVQSEVASNVVIMTNATQTLENVGMRRVVTTSGNRCHDVLMTLRGFDANDASANPDNDLGNHVKITGAESGAVFTLESFAEFLVALPVERREALATLLTGTIPAFADGQ